MRRVAQGGAETFRPIKIWKCLGLLGGKFPPLLAASPSSPEKSRIAEAGGVLQIGGCTRMNWKRILIGKWSWKRPFVSLGSIYLLLAIFAVSCADRILFVPPASSYETSMSGLELLETPEKESIAFLYIPPAPGKKTLLFSHGNAEDMGNYLSWFQQLRTNGLGIAAYDYPGYGQSTGTPSEASCERAISAAWERLMEKGVKPQDIIIMGRSVGSGPSVWLAGREKDTAGMILLSPFKSAFTTVTRIPILPGDRFPNLKRIKNINLPLLVIHGTEDGVINCSHGESLVEACPSTKKTYHPIEGAGHNDVFQLAGDEFIELIVGFAEGLK
ncbi:MAG: alpha/beta hydrolase [Luteolibacter sp.]